MLLLDANVWGVLAEPDNAYHGAVRTIVVDLARPLVGLDLTLYEIANVFARKQDRPDDAKRISRLLKTRCGGRLIRIDDDLLDSIVDLATKHGLTSYDAAYVAAADRYGMTLVSTDLRDLVSKGLAVTPDAAL